VVLHDDRVLKVCIRHGERIAAEQYPATDRQTRSRHAGVQGAAARRTRPKFDTASGRRTVHWSETGNNAPTYLPYIAVGKLAAVDEAHQRDRDQEKWFVEMAQIACNTVELTVHGSVAVRPGYAYKLPPHAGVRSDRGMLATTIRSCSRGCDDTA
jgi:hypothetical protein